MCKNRAAPWAASDYMDVKTNRPCQIKHWLSAVGYSSLEFLCEMHFCCGWLSRTEITWCTWPKKWCKKTMFICFPWKNQCAKIVRPLGPQVTMDVKTNRPCQNHLMLYLWPLFKSEAWQRKGKNTSCPAEAVVKDTQGLHGVSDESRRVIFNAAARAFDRHDDQVKSSGWKKITSSSCPDIFFLCLCQVSTATLSCSTWQMWKKCFSMS